jgi:hypothetical protein
MRSFPASARSKLVVRLTLEGKTFREVIAETGLDERAVSNVLRLGRKLGVIPAFDKPKADVDTITESLLSGDTPEQAAVKAKCHVRTVHRVKADLIKSGRLAKPRRGAIPGRRIEAVRREDLPVRIISRPGASNADLIAEYIAMNGVKKCPTVALVPTQATLERIPDLPNPLHGITGWAGSNTGQKRRAARKGALANLKTCRIGSVI